VYSLTLFSAQLLEQGSILDFSAGTLCCFSAMLGDGEVVRDCPKAWQHLLSFEFGFR